MYKQVNERSETPFFTLATRVLLCFAVAVALVSRPVDHDADTSPVNKNTRHEQLGLTGHGDHAGHNHSTLHNHAKHDDAAAFSLLEMLGLPSVTTENFPVEPVAQLARRVAADLQPGIHRPIHVVTVNRRERTPVAAVARNQSMCIVILNSNPSGWSVWSRFFSRVSEQERMNVAELAIAHEIGHCAEREMNGADKVAEGFDPLEGETFADIFATLYAQNYMGERATVALQTLRDLREEFASAEPTHATGERLRALQSQFADLQHRHLTPVLMAQTAGQLLTASAN